jgi:hypothetical protein
MLKAVRYNEASGPGLPAGQERTMQWRPTTRDTIIGLHLQCDADETGFVVVDTATGGVHGRFQPIRPVF